MEIAPDMLLGAERDDESPLQLKNVIWLVEC